MSYTYDAFLELIFSPIHYFVNWLSMVSNSLIHNYFFITILGLTIFVSLFWLFFDSIINFLHNKIDKYEDYNNKYLDYEEYQKIQQDYYYRHRLDIFAYKYDKYAMGQQIIISFFERNKDLLFDYKVQNLKLNKLATYNYLLNNNDIESAIDYHNFRLKRVVANDYLKSYHDDEIDYKVNLMRLNHEAKVKRSKDFTPGYDEKILNLYDKKIASLNNSLTPEEQKEFNDLIDNF